MFAWLLDLLDALYIVFMVRDPEERARLTGIRELRNRLRADERPYYRRLGNAVTSAFAEDLQKLRDETRQLALLSERTIASADASVRDTTRAAAVRKFIFDDKPVTEDLTAERMMARYDETADVEAVLRESDQKMREIRNRAGRDVAIDIKLAWHEAERVSELSRFDYEGLLAYFTPGGHATAGEASKFRAVAVSDVRDPLTDFFFVLAGCHAAMQAEPFIDLLAERAGMSDSTRKVLGSYRQLRKLLTESMTETRVMDLVRLAHGKPMMAPKRFEPREDPVADYLETVRVRFRQERAKFNAHVRESTVASRVQRLFRDAELLDVDGYTSKASETWSAQGYAPFEYCRIASIVKSFHALYEADMRDTVNRILVDGYFNDRGYQQDLTSNFFNVDQIKDRFFAFEQQRKYDETLSTAALKTLFQEAQESRKSARTLSERIERVNRLARQLVEGAVAQFNKLKTHVEEAIEDGKRKTPEHVINIRSIAGEANPQWRAELQDVQIKLEHFIEIAGQYVAVQQGPVHEPESSQANGPTGQ